MIIVHKLRADNMEFYVIRTNFNLDRELHLIY